MFGVDGMDELTGAGVMDSPVGCREWVGRESTERLPQSCLMVERTRKDAFTEWEGVYMSELFEKSPLEAIFSSSFFSKFNKNYFLFLFLSEEQMWYL